MEKLLLQVPAAWIGPLVEGEWFNSSKNIFLSKWYLFCFSTTQRMHELVLTSSLDPNHCTNTHLFPGSTLTITNLVLEIEFEVGSTTPESLQTRPWPQETGFIPHLMQYKIHFVSPRKAPILASLQSPVTPAILRTKSIHGEEKNSCFLSN